MTARYRIAKDRDPIHPDQPWLLLRSNEDATAGPYWCLHTAATQQGALALLVAAWRALEGRHLCGADTPYPWSCQSCNNIATRWWNDPIRLLPPIQRVASAASYHLDGYITVQCPGHEHQVPVWSGPAGRTATLRAEDFERCVTISAFVTRFNERASHPEALECLDSSSPQPITVPDGMTFTPWLGGQ